ncbi:MAG: SusC/RagA family TonB-linked outer membrane protein [Runella sp.]
MNKPYFNPISKTLIVVLLCLWSTATFAQRKITGKITDSEAGTAMPGVTVLVKGTNVGATSDNNGMYSISAPDNATLVFSFVGYLAQEIPVGNRSTIDLALAPDVNLLNEVIVTGYTSERKKDIIGSVAVVNTKTTLQQPSSNIGNMLQGRAAGVTVSGTGAPGAAAKIRIRGFTSFGNNDPLYIIDGVPTDNANSLNPQDVESIQVLKDPVSASIYGSRAANGVIVVTTRQGGAKTEISYDGYYGLQSIPNRAYPRLLDTQGYYEFLQRSFQGAGIPFRSSIFQNGIPQFLVTSMDVRVRPTDGTNPDRSRYFVDPMTGNNTYQIYETSPGTDWHREITQTAPVQSHQITATGGSDKGAYSLGLNYFGSDGVFKLTHMDRVTLRANTRFKPTKWLTVGENFQMAFTRQRGSSGNPFDLGGGLDFAGEGNPWAQAYRMVPYLPVRDINGNWAGNGIGESGNGTNPVAALHRAADNRFVGFNFFGNVYAQIQLMKDLTFSSSFGIDQRIGNGWNFTYVTFERAENQRNNIFSEYFFRGGSWTWTNSLQYQKTIGKHNFKLFGATESILEQFRSINGSRQDYDFNDPSFWSLNTGKNLPQNGGAPSTPRALYSVFGKAEYQFNDKYLFSATVRRDASSVFGPENRVGVFPAFGVGWRISEEPFMKSLTAVSDLKLRGGWGQMGSQRNVAASNAFSFFSANLFSTAYDISGGNGLPVIGFRPAVVGNPGTKWEAAEMVNIGLDGSLWNGKLNFTAEFFNNTTRDLLVDRQRNGLEPNVGQPRINVGTMLNRGFDASISTRGNITRDLSYDFGFTFTHYINRAVRIDAEGVSAINFGAGRLGNMQRVEAGQPLSSFWGWIVDGIFQTQAEVDAHAAMSYKRVGSWKIRDVNGDGVINAGDQTWIGNPIPKFQMGGDIILKYKNFDFQTFLFWNYGNDIFNYTKWWTHLRGFVGGVDRAVLEDSWTPQNPNARLPILNANDNFSGVISTTYYVEKGSFLRARQAQLGYTFTPSLARKLGLSRARAYLQAQNLFTITNYSGPDPDIGILGGSDLQMGVDQFRTPAPRTIIFGFNFAF